MTSENDNTQFIDAALSHGMLSQELAMDVLKNLRCRHSIVVL